MNRRKTTQLLNEWKSFLSESTEPKFKEEDEEKLKVVVEDCCGSCSEKEEFTSLNIPKQGNPLEGVLVERNGPNYGEQNIVIVRLKGEKKPRHFPQCCVKRKSDVK